MSIRKPAFPKVATQDLKAGLDKLSSTIEQVRQVNGKLSMKKLGEAVKASGDPDMRAALSALEDSFSREQPIRVSSGCGGSSIVGYEDVPASKLESEEVLSVLGALMKAKQKLDKLDKNDDGLINPDELGSLKKYKGMSGDVLKALVQRNLTGYVRALREWTDDLNQVSFTVRDRKEVEADIAKLTKYHCKHKNGAEALSWAFREIATRGQGHHLNPNLMESVLERAEKGGPDDNPLAVHFEGGNSDNLKQGHLSNAEIRSVLGTEDLEGFSRSMKAKIKERVGVDYADYVSGKDLDADGQRSDPDFTGFTAYDGSLDMNRAPPRTRNRTTHVSSSC